MNKNYLSLKQPAPIDEIFGRVDRIIHRMAQPRWVPRQELIADYAEAMGLLAKARRLTDNPQILKAVQWRRDMLNDAVFPKEKDSESVANEEIN